MLNDFKYLINLSAKIQPANDESKMIFLDCVCGDDEYSILGFSFRIFLRRFHLKIDLDHAYSELTSWYAAQPLSHETQIEVSMSEDLSNEHKSEGTGKVGLEAASASMELSSNKAETAISTKSKSLKYNDNIRRVTVSGRNDSIRWEINKLPHESFINGPIFVNEKMLNVTSSEESSGSISISLPVDGVFISPKGSKDVREKRALAIFSLVMRKRLCSHDHTVASLSL